MRHDLTKSVIDSLTCPPGKKDVLVFDLKLPGFAVRVTANGVKVFLVQYSRGGRTNRVTIGRMGVVTPAEARRKALELIGAIQGGGDPVAERRSASAALEAAEAEQAQRAEERRKADEFTVARLLDTWQAIKLKDRSESYRREAPRVVRRLLGDLEHAPAASISTAALQIIIDREIERVPVQTIDARACGKAAWNWAMKRGLVQANPFANVVIERRVKSRDRVLTDAELADTWRAAAAKPYPFGPAVQILVLTLQRLSEVTGMRWSELAPDLSTWTIPAPRSKNRRAHVVHLADPAREILTALRDRRDMLAAARRAERAGRGDGTDDVFDNDLIFSTTGKTPASGVGRARRSLDPEVLDDENALSRERRSPGAKKMAKPATVRTRTDWRFHDFRRTGVSKLAELGIPPHVADRVLNHVTGSIQGVAAVYQRFEFLPERKRALDVWAAHVLAVACGDAQASNVLKLPNALDRARDGAA
ncbi:site-specific integrase [Acidocella sp.]|uniref:tyrosine-type recombinase/integrase n=1 Tax=Acidocella sp. TaxID=50710 RepID=UPI0017EEBA83|nr:integrase arm-type DNA-binding domain-containing protein [Acidocella sp.]NNM56303.1 integrase arm-type DNA-binding domain-containing protein [Acidocella sp.]